MMWGIYSSIYGEVNVSVEKCVEIKGDYAEEKKRICFISVTLKSWSGRKLLQEMSNIKFMFEIIPTNICRRDPILLKTKVTHN